MTTMSPATADQAAAIIADYFRPPILALEALAAPIAEQIAAELARGPMSANKLDALVAPFAGVPHVVGPLASIAVRARPPWATAGSMPLR